MSDEALLINTGKQTPPAEAFQNRSAIATPAEITNISVFGVFADDTAIEQIFTLRLPKGAPQDQIALVVWDQVSKLGGITVAGVAGEYNFYPLAVFKRLTLKIGNVVGVSLG